MEGKCKHCKKSYSMDSIGVWACKGNDLCINGSAFEPRDKGKESINDIYGGVSAEHLGKAITITSKEMVNHPRHYNMGKYEAIDVIEDWQLNFNLGNTVKYISRAGHKDDIVQDLKKALWYLEREIKRIENTK